MPQISYKVFLDSSFLLSFIDRADLNHQKTIQIFELLGKQEYKLYTSILVVLATFSRLEKDFGATLCNDFLQAILESNIQILFASDSDLISAFRFLKSNPGRNISLPEFINSYMMEKQGVQSILTYDYWHNVMGTTLSHLISS